MEKYLMYKLGVLKRFSGSRLIGIGTGTDRLIEELELKNPIPVPVSVLTF